jgi:Uma2 family endonuclease
VLFTCFAEIIQLSLTLHMPASIKILPHYTYDEYKNWEGKWELIEGIPHAMSPAPNIKHQRTSGNLYIELALALRTSNCSCQVYQPIDYKISEDTVVQPDLLILCKQPKEAAYLNFPPSLVVEILSPSTAHKDRITKYELYEQQKIPYYLIVDIDKKLVEIYVLNNHGRYELKKHEDNFQFELDNNCLIQVSFRNIWV